MARFKVGELAQRTGVSIRTLHHYDEIGLLRPSLRTASGRHRLYGEGDVIRLQRILALKDLGFSLDEVRLCLAGRDFSPLELVERHLEQLDQQLAAGQRLRQRLARLAEGMRTDADLSTAEFLATIEEMTVFDRYFDEQQQEQLARRRREIGAARIREVEREWPDLIAAMRAEMTRGTDPRSATVLALAERWQALVDEFTGGDRDIARSVDDLYAGEPGARQRHDLDAELMAYVGRARAGRGAPPAAE